MLEKIQNWLKNPKRKYAEGLEYFNRFANKKQQDNFGKFLNDGVADTPQFDPAGRFPLLINQVVFVLNRLRSNPGLYAASQSDSPVSTGATTGTTGNEKGSGDKIDINSLPEELSAERDRLKEIVPVMAKIHADMSDEKIADDKRAALRTELVKLDDERRAIWDKIESFNPNVEKSDQEKQVEQNMFDLGRQTALRIGQLKSYITRNREALVKHEAAKNEKKAENAKEKIEAYEKELAELESLFKKE